MTAEIHKESSSKTNPKLFNVWLLNIGIVMLFAGLTSAYIVRRADGNWLDFELPSMFLYSTIIVLLSSVSLYYALRSAKQDELGGVKLGLILTIGFALAFCVTQYLGWQAMLDQGLYFVNNQSEGEKVSASFVFAISALHLLHIVGGIIFLLVTAVKAFNLEVHKKNTNLIVMCNTYWHFIGLLWVYLYLFFYFAPGF
ncbi:cytochrome oxidase subunit III [bacterium]|nr:cytochrome oxidase subunit III [bacterium]